MKVGVIGTGMLGAAVVMHLLESNYTVYVYNRTRDKTIPLQENGAKVLDSPKDVASMSDVVITCVKDADAIREIAFEKDGIIFGAHKGLIVADMSTIHPVSSKEIAARYLDDDIVMLDIPVMGGPNVAIHGKLVMMISGDVKSYEKCKSLFETIAHKTFYLGKVSTAHLVKLSMNLQIAMLSLSLSEGITLARAANIDPQVFLKILNSTYFKTGMSENKAYKMIDDKFDATFTLSNLTKDLRTINDTAKSLQIHLPMSLKAHEIYQNAVDDGLGDLDYTGILAYLKKHTRL